MQISSHLGHLRVVPTLSKEFELESINFIPKLGQGLVFLILENRYHRFPISEMRRKRKGGSFTTFSTAIFNENTSLRASQVA